MDVEPKRAFNLKDCVLIAGIPQNGYLKFQLKGSNCCQDYKSKLFDQRGVWTFSGEEAQVGAMLMAMRAFAAPVPFLLSSVD